MIAERPLQKYLNTLKSNTGISSATLITEDGLLIASDEASDTLERMAHLAEIGAISAGIISMSERAIELITDKNLDQITLKGGKDSEDTSVTIILTSIYENIILLVLFPSNLNIGLILYEIEEIKKEIEDFMNANSDKIILNPESVL
ncbi:MAG: roadblock/LC7 domain-containing protein [Candidatus Odinarchaeia archaeon]